MWSIIVDSSFDDSYCVKHCERVVPKDNSSTVVAWSEQTLLKTHDSSYTSGENTHSDKVDHSGSKYFEAASYMITFFGQWMWHWCNILLDSEDNSTVGLIEGQWWRQVDSEVSEEFWKK